MNTFEFFNAHFGRHLVPQTGEPWEDAYRALATGYPLPGRAPDKQYRKKLESGWAIIRPGRSTMTVNRVVTGIEIIPPKKDGGMTSYEAFCAELEAWDGEPRLFLCFTQKTFSTRNLFLTVDPREVCVCEPKIVERFDWLAPSNNPGKHERNIRKHAGQDGPPRTPPPGPPAPDRASGNQDRGRGQARAAAPRGANPGPVTGPSIPGQDTARPPARRGPERGRPGGRRESA